MPTTRIAQQSCQLGSRACDHDSRHDHPLQRVLGTRVLSAKCAETLMPRKYHHTTNDEGEGLAETLRGTQAIFLSSSAKYPEAKPSTKSSTAKPISKFRRQAVPGQNVSSWFVAARLVVQPCNKLILAEWASLQNPLTRLYEMTRQIAL